MTMHRNGRPGLIVALDNPDLEANEKLAEKLAGSVDAFKVGLTLFSNHGPEAISRIGRFGPVFYDAKLHDIPEQTRGAAKAIAGHGAWMFTAHASGGREMIEAVVNGAGGESIVAAVTVLTSLNCADIAGEATRLARMAKEAGAGAVVCSGLEAAEVRKTIGPEILIVVPGVRPAGSVSHDQARVVTPTEASTAGADYLVVGRPITGSRDPLEAATNVLDQMVRA